MRRQAIAALIGVALLIAAGLFLARSLGGADRVQDCVMQGRTNCAPAP